MVDTLTQAHAGYRHEAVLYDGPEDYLDSTAPFVADGVRAGQPVMVAVPGPRLSALRSVLRSALGDDASHVLFVDMAELGANPAHIIPAWREFVDDPAHRGRPLRGVGEPVWAGRRPEEVAECQLHEALLNVALRPDTRLWLRCPYDVRALDDAVLEEAHHSHPVLVEQDAYTGSRAYGGVQHVSTMFGADLAEPEGRTHDLEFDDGSLRSVRATVSRLARGAGLTQDRSAHLSLALHEVVVNSIRHGGGSGTLRVWREPGALVCEVRDSGRIEDPLAGRRQPEPTDESGRGLWMVHHLCDLVQIRCTPRGTTVRIFTWL
ncbi:MAG: anti-sigma factor RsbA family regulatory protein [Nocardioidaceae bacterium]